MEFVGKIVKKDFRGHGVFSGVVQSYDASSGLFEIVYGDGDSEELDFSEVASLLEQTEAEPGEHKPRLGRRPKKRRRLDLTRREKRGGSGNSNCNSHTQSVVETLRNGNFDLNDGLIEDLREAERGNDNLGSMTAVDLNEGVNGCGLKEMLDLNAGFDLNLNEGFDLNEDDGINVSSEGNLKKRRECIDLNMDVNGDVDENLVNGSSNNHLGTQKRECRFDLNLGIDEEIKDEEQVGDCGQQAKEKIPNQETQRMEDAGIVLERVYNEDGAIAKGILQEVHVSNDLLAQSAKGICKKSVISGEDSRGIDSVEVQDTKTVKEDPPEVINENQGNEVIAYQEETGGGRKRRGRRRKVKDADSLNSTPQTAIFTDATVIYGNQDDIRSIFKDGNGNQRRQRRGKPVDALNTTPNTVATTDAHGAKEDCDIVTDEVQGDTGTAFKEVTGSRRKRRRISDHMNATPEMTVLRRSTRRGTAKNDVLTATSLSMVNGLLVSPAVSALAEEKPAKSCHGWHEEPVVLPAMVQLPPSSRNLDLDGNLVVDLFSVYACLRSFSTLLFLSPFDLEEFVAALKCNTPSSLFDCIHVSILQTLKKHVEYLSNEGSESASNCLRSLNWGFLDLITWPVFMVEYFLIHGTDLKPGINLSHLKLLKDDYYKQPVSLKIEILRCLCDGMIEVDILRSELNRRSSGAESDIDIDRNMNFGALKKRRSGMDVSTGSCLTEDTVDESTDWNSDECCLCKMDGNLICCDGCPAAYHSKCVGVANDSLPEGDWFCPECAIDRHKPWMKTRNSLRGAELLGVDPYGRLYFSSCGYLLVSESCETESSFNYYHRDDLNAVIKVLRSSEMIYSSILKAILNHWEIPVSSNGASCSLGSLNHGIYLNKCVVTAAFASSEADAIKNETAGERQPGENFVTGCSGHIHIDVSKSVSQTCLSSEGSAETTQTSLENQNFKKEKPDCSNKSTEPMGDNCLEPPCLDSKKANVIRSAANSYPSFALNGKNGDASQIQPETSYLNYYNFGHIASSVAEDLLHKSSDKTIEDSIKSEEEIISAQMKILSKRCPKFHWSSIPRLNVDVQKEKCGWCFSCRASSDDPGCLFNMTLSSVGGEGSAIESAGLQAKGNKKGHLTDIISHVLVIEDRLQGLLLGPWLNPNYSKLWRKSVLKASDIVSLKHLLLTLESNLSRLALSAEWLKHVDSSPRMGSASHIVMASLRASSKNGISKKRARFSEFDSNPSSNSSSGLSMLWWRGGRLSRQLFSWKVLPHSLASKGARQAGCMKISGMLYPENSDFAKRSKYIAWRAAVESSNTVEQIALQVRELDSNIRWDEIGNRNPLLMMDKESRKSIRLFKKVIIRRKSMELEGAKYLLDFGKRKCIPEIVSKNGSIVEESSSERKKYWLNESYVPLYLLKSFEQKRIARRSSKMTSGKLSDASVSMKKPLKKRGFSYLFAKAERPEHHQCGHCNKDVPVREAVCCQYCKGFFHKRHVRKSAGSMSAECKYTCHRCVAGKYMKMDSKTGKNDEKRGKNKNRSTKTHNQKSKKTTVGSSSVHPKNSKKTLRSSRLLRSQKNKKATVVVPLRRSPRKAKLNSLQNKKSRGRKKGKQAKPKKTTGKKPTKVTSWRKKRTQAYHNFWLNGLFLTRKPDDERVMHFRRKRFLAPSESAIHDQPKCHLCSEAGNTSTLSYISCEICGEWYHGAAFGLDAENSNKLIGFRCHMCRNCKPPVCPFVAVTRNHESQMASAENDVENELSIEGTNLVEHPTETNLFQDSLLNEDHRGSLPADDPVHREDDHSFVPKSKLEIANGNVLNNLKESTDAVQISDEYLNPELISCNENHTSKESAINSGHDAIVRSHDQMQPPSFSVGVDAMGTFGSVRDESTTAFLKSPLDGALYETIELHPQSFTAAAELFDAGGKQAEI
ncbi:DDT domain-containing protein PTM [Ricinus communis]|uniref:DDT domain-containing protein PTM n=1 Tax=Ricinus communis TaxID=3988 RepID=UPI00201A5454|nr:DDT domain-containing protein PTM [Ricinus communis]